MSDEAYPIIVNPDPKPQKRKQYFKKSFFILSLLILILAVSSLIAFRQRLQFQFQDRKEKELAGQLPISHRKIWVGVFEFDTKNKIASLKEGPQVSEGEILAPTISEKPETDKDKWIFRVVVEKDTGEIIYSSYRTSKILPSSIGSDIWDFGVAVPYKETSILRIFDLEENQIYALNL